MLDVLVDLWTEAISTLLGPLWDSIVFWRMLALILILAAGLVGLEHKRILKWLVTRHRRPADVKHDTDVFLIGDQYLGESTMDGICNQLYNGWLTSKDIECLSNFKQDMQRVRATFHIEEIESYKTNLLANIDDILCFTGTHFFPVSEESIYSLYPGPETTVRARRDELMPELQQHAHKLWDDYEAYRRCVNRWLGI